MQNTEELRLLALAPAELRLLIAMRHLEDRWQEVTATMSELSELTGYGRTTLSRAVAGLESSGFITKTRTKRNYAFKSNNKYTLLHGSLQRTSTAEDVQVEENAEFVTFAGKKIPFRRSPERTSTEVDNKDIVDNKDLLVINTSYLLVPAGNQEQKQENEMVNNWSDDDDNIGGFGLFEGEMTSAQKQQSLSKRTTKNRHLRPQDDWTAADVATEFASRLYKRIPGVPALINTNTLRGVLAANRKRFNLDATIEMECLERFFADERNITLVRQSPQQVIGIFVKSITASVQDVVSDLGMDDAPVVDKPAESEYVYASDGREFDKSISGRAAMARYEEKLRNANV